VFLDSGFAVVVLTNNQDANPDSVVLGIMNAVCNSSHFAGNCQSNLIWHVAKRHSMLVARIASRSSATLPCNRSLRPQRCMVQNARRASTGRNSPSGLQPKAAGLPNGASSIRSGEDGECRRTTEGKCPSCCH